MISNLWNIITLNLGWRGLLVVPLGLAPYLWIYSGLLGYDQTQVCLKKANHLAAGSPAHLKFMSESDETKKKLEACDFRHMDAIADGTTKQTIYEFCPNFAWKPPELTKLPFSNEDKKQIRYIGGGCYGVSLFGKHNVRGFIETTWNTD